MISNKQDLLHRIDDAASQYSGYGNRFPDYAFAHD